MFCMHLGTKSDYFPIRHGLPSVTGTECAYCAIWTEPSNKTDYIIKLKIKLHFVIKGLMASL